jgi:uncharacterized RDD family membrane protein YckC
VENEWSSESGSVLLDVGPAVDKHAPGWWLPEEANGWESIEPEAAGPATKARPMTAEQMMRRERDFHLYGRGIGGKHLPDHLGRLIAFVVDGAMFGALLVFGTRALESAYPDRFSQVQRYGVVAGASWLLLTMLPLLLWRATPGKLLMGLRIINKNGQELASPRAMLRGLLMLAVPLIAIDLFMIPTTPHRRRLIDYVCGTRVVANY